MQSVRKVRVFIASPQDVKKERKAAVDVILTWNACNSSYRGIMIEPVRMETHAQATIDGHPQDTINRQLLNDCDLLIAIFWSRLGTRTPKAASGTVQEIQEFSQKKDAQNVLLFFSEKTVPLNHDETELERLKDFKKEVQHKSLFISFSGIGGFREKLRQQLDMWMNRVRSPQGVLVSHSTMLIVALGGDKARRSAEHMVTLEPDMAGTRIDDFRSLRTEANRSLYVMGVGMTVFSADVTLMRTLLTRGLSVRLLMIDPDVIVTSRSRRGGRGSPDVSIMERSFSAFFSRKEYGSDVRASLSRLKELVAGVAALKGVGDIELRVYPYFLPMNFTAIDESTNGKILIEFCLPFSDQRLRLLLSKQHDGEVFDRILENCERLWEMSTIIGATHAKRKPRN